MFITDPGPGNIKVTCKDPELMKGVVVHTEHIDRGEIKDKSLVEAYRIPAHINAAKVRLHVGADAPCCAFIGRPVFEGVGHEYEFVNDALHGFDLFKVHVAIISCNYYYCYKPKINLDHAGHCLVVMASILHTRQLA